VRYVAFLRAVNVGRNRQVKMEQLRALLTEAGYENVSTYIQSGNVFFDSSSRSKKKLTADLEARLAQEFGFDIPVILRTTTELDALIASKPFGTRVADDDTRLLVTFTPEREWCDVIPVVNGKWEVPKGRKEGTGRFWHTLLKIADAATR
jgi:uncharacterized protein (DUF1697 family)